MNTNEIYELITTYNRIDKSTLGEEKAFEIFDLVINEGEQFAENLPRAEFYQALIPVINDALSNSKYEDLYKTYLFRILFQGLFAYKSRFNNEIKQLFSKFHIQTWKLWDEALVYVFQTPEENLENLPQDDFYSHLKNIVYVEFWSYLKGESNNDQNFNRVINWMEIQNQIMVKKIYNPYA